MWLFESLTVVWKSDNIVRLQTTVRLSNLLPSKKWNSSSYFLLSCQKVYSMITRLYDKLLGRFYSEHTALTSAHALEWSRIIGSSTDREAVSEGQPCSDPHAAFVWVVANQILWCKRFLHLSLTCLNESWLRQVLCLSSRPLLSSIKTGAAMLFSQNYDVLLWTVSGMVRLSMLCGFSSWQAPAYSSLVSKTKVSSA